MRRSRELIHLADLLRQHPVLPPRSLPRLWPACDLDGLRVSLCCWEYLRSARLHRDMAGATQLFHPVLRRLCAIFRLLGIAALLPWGCVPGNCVAGERRAPARVDVFKSNHDLLAAPSHAGVSATLGKRDFRKALYIEDVVRTLGARSWVLPGCWGGDLD